VVSVGATPSDARTCGETVTATGLLLSASISEAPEYEIAGSAPVTRAAYVSVSVVAAVSDVGETDEGAVPSTAHCVVPVVPLTGFEKVITVVVVVAVAAVKVGTALYTTALREDASYALGVAASSVTPARSA